MTSAPIEPGFNPTAPVVSDHLVALVRLLARKAAQAGLAAHSASDSDND